VKSLSHATTGQPAVAKLKEEMSKLVVYEKQMLAFAPKRCGL
jgi:hypothetical protein